MTENYKLVTLLTILKVNCIVNDIFKRVYTFSREMVCKL